MPITPVDIDEDNRAAAHELEPVNTGIRIEFRTKIVASAHLRYDPALDFVQRHDLACLPLREGAVLVALAARVGRRRQQQAREAGGNECLDQHGRLHGIGRLNRQ